MAVVRPQMLDAVLAVCERWELHHAVDRRGDGHRPAARALGRRGRRRDPGPAPDRRVPALHDRAASRAPEPSHSLLEAVEAPAAPRRCSSCSARRTSAAASGSSAATTTSSARAPCGGPASTRPCSGCGPATAGSRSRSTARAGWAASGPRTGGRARRARGGAQRRLHGRRAARADRLPQLRQPGEGRDRWELAESIEGMAEACEALGIPIVSGNVSLYNETDGRAIDPTPGRRLCRAARGRAARAGALARGRRDPARRRLAGRARRLRVPGALGRGRRSAGPARPRRRGVARRVPLACGAAVLARPRRLARRPRGRAGRGRDPLAARRRASSLPDDPRAWFGEGGGQAVLACAPDVVDLLGGVPMRRLGVAGGDGLLGSSSTS